MKHEKQKIIMYLLWATGEINDEQYDQADFWIKNALEHLEKIK